MMELDVIMPKLGLTMEEGLLVRWLKKSGDFVKAGEVIFEVETDKSIQEVESPGDGTLSEILVAEGSTVPVATLVARISSEESHPLAIPPFIVVKSQEPESLSSVAEPIISTPLQAERQVDQQGGSRNGGRRFISWRAKRVARELGVDLKLMGPGSGPEGRIIERDVQEAAIRLNEDQKREVIELTPVQRKTAERMVQSFSEVPHFYLTAEVNAERLLDLRQVLLPKVQDTYGVRLTLNDILVKITAVSLVKHPRANASWDDGNLRLNEAIDIGFATTSPSGLLVPVIRHANLKSIGEIAAIRAALITKAQNATLGQDEMIGGSFTLTNLGMYGIDQFQAMIDPPQSVILAVGRIKERPVGENGQVVLKPVFTLTLSCDHRVLDEFSGAAFLRDLMGYIECPISLL
jgi:pyruvate dehydrogenase E2 component (dihydrolipoamide acetyltransferase)